MNWFKQIARTFLSRGEPKKALVVRRQSGSDLKSLLERLLSARPNAKETEFVASLEARRGHLRSILDGTIRETSFRHVMQEMDAGKVFEGVSSPQYAAVMLYRLAEVVQPKWCAEFGSAFGVGSYALARGMADTPGARFDGFEFEQWRADIAQVGVSEAIRDRGRIHAGPVEKTFPTIANERGELELAFVDAMHTFEATSGYHELLLPTACTGAIIVYDDINWSDGMRRFWDGCAVDSRLSDAIAVDGRWGVVRVK